MDNRFLGIISTKVALKQKSAGKLSLIVTIRPLSIHATVPMLGSIVFNITGNIHFPIFLIFAFKNIYSIFML